MTENINPNDPVEHLLGMRSLAQAWAGDSSAGTSLQMLAIRRMQQLTWRYACA